MTRTVACLGLAIGALALAAAALGIGGASAQPAPMRVIDRTLVCEIANFGVVHVLEGGAYSAVRQQKRPASVGLTTEVRPTWRLVELSESSIELSPACRRSSASVRFSPKALRGGGVSGIGVRFACGTPREVLIRVRATFTKPVTLRFVRPVGRGPALRALGKVSQGSLAVRTLQGKQLVYGEVAAGRARLFTRTPACIPK